MSQRRRIALLPALSLAAAALPALCGAPAFAAPPRPADARSAPSADAARIARWAVRTGDNQHQPFAVIDKRNARLLVYAADGRLRGSAPVLLGLARGDDTVPGIGDRPLKDVLPHERTTPAGRFVSEHGTNLRREDILWIDYDAAVSMHPVLTTNAKERRQHRLDTRTIADNRISYGCVNVPKAFFANVVLKTLSAPHPIVYVLPETRPLQAVFSGFPGSAGARLAAGSPPTRK